MKKRKILSTTLVITGLLVSSPAVYGAISTPHVAGDFQAWDPAASPMTETFSGSGIWTLGVTGLTAGSRHEFKITDGTWGTALPGANSWLFADAFGNVTVTYDGNTYSDGWSSSSDRIGLSTDPGTWTIAGSFQGWDNANPATAMTPIGGGIYQYEQTLAPGTHLWKAVVTGSWDSISWDSRSVGTADWEISLAAESAVVFRVDALSGVAQVIVPEPTTAAVAGLGAAALLIWRRRKI